MMASSYHSQIGLRVMSDFLSVNLAVIANRWPELHTLLLSAASHDFQPEIKEGLSATLVVNGIQLTSRHDRVLEARAQADSLPDEPVLHVYGIGLGDLPRILLQRKALSQLHIFILNEALFMLVNNLLDHSDWLADSRVVLHVANEFKEIKLPFFVSPPELQLTSKANTKIRDRLASEVEIEFINQRFTADNPQFNARLAENERYIQQDNDVAELFNQYRGRDAYILASGPTLSNHYDKLAAIATRANRPLLIALDTALRGLISHHIFPDIVVSIDKEINPGHLPEKMVCRPKLIYFPLVHSSLLAAWEGERYCAYSRSVVYEAMSKKHPKAKLFASGSVIHPAVDFAVKAGVKSITFFGADFSFPYEKTHSGWDSGVLCVPVEAAKHSVLNGNNEEVKTHLNFRGYLCSLERFIAHHPNVKFYNTSKEGAYIEGTVYHPEFINDAE